MIMSKILIHSQSVHVLKVKSTILKFESGRGCQKYQTFKMYNLASHDWVARQQSKGLT